MKTNTLWNLLGTFVVALIGGLLGASLMSPSAPEAGPIPPTVKSGIVATYGVGGVVTASGAFWQYRPDKDGWVSLDESFALESETTKIAPLPVPMAQVAHIETFGFLVDRDDNCWLYNIEGQKWQNIGKPPLK